MLQRNKDNNIFNIGTPSARYASCVWDPHQQCIINALEKVQRCAARWVALEYNPTSGVTYLLDQLHWKSLQMC